MIIILKIFPVTQMIGYSKSIGYSKDIMMENLNSITCQHALEEEDDDDEDEVIILALLATR